MKVNKDMKLLGHVNKAGVVLKPLSPQLKEIYIKIKELFSNIGIELILEKESALMIDENGLEKNVLFRESDFLISVGGDGTLLSLIRQSINFNKAVLGINLGTLGFLTDINIDELDKFLISFNKKEYKIDNRMMIEGSINNNSFMAFNDIVISRNSISSMINIDAKIDEEHFNSYYGDGVIISTPTGSTAYNLSVGGPLVYPLTEAFIITPIASHSLSQRPLVMPADFEIEFTIADMQGALVIIDGQDIHDMKMTESIKIKIANKRAQMIHRRERNYFNVLNEKLAWGN